MKPAPTEITVDPAAATADAVRLRPFEPTYTAVEAAIPAEAG